MGGRACVWLAVNRGLNMLFSGRYNMIWHAINNMLWIELDLNFHSISSLHWFKNNDPLSIKSYLCFKISLACVCAAWNDKAPDLPQCCSALVTSPYSVAVVTSPTRLQHDDVISEDLTRRGLKISRLCWNRKVHRVHRLGWFRRAILKTRRYLADPAETVGVEASCPHSCTNPSVTQSENAPTKVKYRRRWECLGCCGDRGSGNDDSSNSEPGH